MSLLLTSSCRCRDGGLVAEDSRLINLAAGIELRATTASDCGKKALTIKYNNRLLGPVAANEIIARSEKEADDLVAFLDSKLNIIATPRQIGDSLFLIAPASPEGDSSSAWLPVVSGLLHRQHFPESKGGLDSEVAKFCPSCGTNPLEFFDLPNKDSDFEGDAALNLKSLSATRPSCKGAPVAIVDSGVDYKDKMLEHAFDGVVWTGLDIVGVDNEPLPEGASHGTLMARIIAHKERGYCADATIVPIRVLKEDDANDVLCAYHTTIADGLKKVAGTGAKIVNFSLNPRLPSAALEDAFLTLQSQEILVIASAGNDSFEVLPASNTTGSHFTYPISWQLSNVVGVTAANSNGVQSGNTSKTLVHLAAPGYFNASPSWGTSISAAHVSAMAAAIKSASPDFDVSALRAALMESAVCQAVVPRKTSSSCYCIPSPFQFTPCKKPCPC